MIWNRGIFDIYKMKKRKGERARSICGLHLPGQSIEARASMRGTNRDLCSGTRVYGLRGISLLPSQWHEMQYSYSIGCAFA